MELTYDDDLVMEELQVSHPDDNFLKQLDGTLRSPDSCGDFVLVHQEYETDQNPEVCYFVPSVGEPSDPPTIGADQQLHLKLQVVDAAQP